jgi:hypothetical protein
MLRKNKSKIFLKWICVLGLQLVENFHLKLPDFSIKKSSIAAPQKAHGKNFHFFESRKSKKSKENNKKQ